MTNAKEWLLSSARMIRSLVIAAIKLPFWIKVKADIQGPWAWSRTGWAKAGFAVAAILAYYGIGGWAVETIDTDPGLMPPPVSQHQLRAVAVAAQLTHREVDKHRWVPADPFFLPGWALTAMPSFQQGIMAAIGHFAETLYMAEGSGDPDLGQAAGLYKYPAKVWRLAPGISWLPTAPSDRQYRHAAQSLEAYDDKLALIPLDPARQLAILTAVLAEVDQELDKDAELLDHHVEARPFALFDHDGTVMFHTTRGQLYAWAVILRELGQDNAETLAAKGLTVTWRHMVDSLFLAAKMSPPMVMTGSWDGSLLPNHLTEQGYLLMRAGELLDDVVAGLKPKLQ